MSSVENARKTANRLQSAKHFEKKIAEVDSANKPQKTVNIQSFENIDNEQLVNSEEFEYDENILNSYPENEEKYEEEKISDAEFSHEADDSLNDDKWDTDIEEEKGKSLSRYNYNAILKLISIQIKRKNLIRFKERWILNEIYLFVDIFKNFVES